MPNDARTPVVVVAGLAAAAAQDVADALLDERTAVVHHDVAQLCDGVLIRRIRCGADDCTTARQLAHGCVSCFLREELLPLLRSLATSADLDRIVLHLDPTMEPETVCWAVEHLKVAGDPLPDLVKVQAVVTVLDAGNWLADATSDQGPVERLLSAGLDDDRTLAQLVVGQVEFADAIIVAGAAADLDTARRTDAVLDRLVPLAPRVQATRLDVEALLAAVPANSRRGRVDDAHAVLTHHTHPWHTEHGVGTVLFGTRRPFHPERLHDAVQILLQGVVRVRGRMWVATQPDQALAVESAGGDLRVARAGRWLGALPDWSNINVERALMASLRWDDQFEDREQALLVIYHAADPEVIVATLDAALITDTELAAGRQQWRTWSDPFGHFHADPGVPTEPAEAKDNRRRRGPS
ncbi:MAG TPA: GTP-binding protein [Pseudonocardiaceae bacterium]|nr:GTP-binding protein [Pseudonocardiaceae bacterium]